MKLLMQNEKKTGVIVLILKAMKSYFAVKNAKKYSQI